MPEAKAFRIFARSAGRNPLDPEAHVFAQSLGIQAVYGRFFDMAAGGSGIIRPAIVRAFEFDSKQGRLTLTIDTTRYSREGKCLSAQDVAQNLRRYIGGKDSIINLHPLRETRIAPIARAGNEVCITGIAALTPVLRALSHPLIRILPGGEETADFTQSGWGDFEIDGAQDGTLRLLRSRSPGGRGPDRVEIYTAPDPQEFDFALWPLAETMATTREFQKVRVDPLAGTYCLLFNFENSLGRSREFRRAMHRGLDMAAVVDRSTPGSRVTNLLIPGELVGEYACEAGFDPASTSSARNTIAAACGAKSVTANVYYGPTSGNSGRDKMSEVMAEIGLDVRWLGTVSSKFRPLDESLFMIRNVCAHRSDPFAMVSQFLSGSPLSSQLFPPNAELTRLCEEYRRLDDHDAIDRQLRVISTFISQESLMIPFAVRDVHGLIRGESGYEFVANGNGIYCDLDCFQRRGLAS